MPKQVRERDSRSESMVAQQVSAWIRERDTADQLVAEWQRLEHELSVRARSLNADFEQILNSDLPESHRIRALSKQIAMADKHLNVSAARLCEQPSNSTDDALAKIKLGLRLAQFPSGDEVPWMLVKAGFLDLQTKWDQPPSHDLWGTFTRTSSG